MISRVGVIALFVAAGLGSGCGESRPSTPSRTPLSQLPTVNVQEGGCRTDADCTVSDAQVCPSACNCARVMTTRAVATLRANAARAECPPEDHHIRCGGCPGITGAACVSGQCVEGSAPAAPPSSPPTPTPAPPDPSGGAES